jgi:hypothetical protein
MVRRESCNIVTKMQARLHRRDQFMTTSPLMPPVCLHDEGVERVNGNHFPNPITLLADFSCGLIKNGRIHICCIMDGPGCPCDGVVAKAAPESTHADGSSLGQEETFPMNVGKNCLLDRLLGSVLCQCPLQIPILHKDMPYQASTGLSHDIIDAPPEALILFALIN